MTPELDRAFRDGHAVAVGALARFLGDLDLAEEAVQDAYVVAIERWQRDGIPDNPAAWIVTTARNRALDVVRRRAVGERKLARLAALESADVIVAAPSTDDALGLLFACCHPALGREARLALMLRLVGGLATAEIARAFLVPEATVAQRLVRAKRKIRDAGIALRPPAAAVHPDRLDDVLTTIVLVFNEGYLSASGDQPVRGGLCDEAIRIARLATEAMPDEAEAWGVLALLLLTDARRDARVDGDEIVLLEDQDRSRWDAARIAEGTAILDRALQRARPGPFQIQAAIAALHATARTPQATDWIQIALLYERLEVLRPSPVVALNAGVAAAMARGPEAGLARIEPLASALDRYHLFHAARAELLRRAGRLEDARESLVAALSCMPGPAERRLLERRLGEIAP